MAKRPIALLLSRLPDARQGPSGEYSAKCPAHDDQHSSLSFSEGDDGKALLKCHAGCSFSEIVAAMGLKESDLFEQRNGGGGGGSSYPGVTRAPVQQSPHGLTLAQYATAKSLPLQSLKEFGLSDMTYMGMPAIRIPYFDESGSEAAIRFRLALEKPEGQDIRFRWKSGAKPCLYGLWRLPKVKPRGPLRLVPQEPSGVVLVEGESDCHTLWNASIDAVGVPGAGMWDEERDAHKFDSYERIYVVIEPDRGGEAVQRWLSRSAIRERVWLLDLMPFEVKDPSGLYLGDPEYFHERWQQALALAVPWTEYATEARQRQAEVAWKECQALADEPHILAKFEETLSTRLAGEREAAQLLFLCLMTRFFERPVSAVVKGPSSAGKSYLVERVLDFFPGETFWLMCSHRAEYGTMVP
jgi:hypothetical protein